jgi:glycosyltransferase involved in cell wall biosynthesis
VRSATAPLIPESTFIVLTHGTTVLPPASGLLDYLIARGARQVTVVTHPLTTEEDDRHQIITYLPEQPPRRRTFRLPAGPPYSYPLDALLPLRAPRVDGWFAFNNLLGARGLLERRLGRAKTVVYWAVDFTPDRFGAGSAMTRAYDAVDAYCCRHVDLRVELSRAALDARDARHQLTNDAGVPRIVAPIGAWLDRVPVTPEDGWRSRRVVFIGHLDERNGVETVLQAMALLGERGVDVTADIAGRGPLEGRLRADAAELGLGDRVRFHGFISDHRERERLMAQASVAVAPYNGRVESWTPYADPSKLKAYLAAGLPILLTDVPHNAHALASDAGAEVLEDAPSAFADAIERTIGDGSTWLRRRDAARDYARQFDWTTIVGDVLHAAGFER